VVDAVDGALAGGPGAVHGARGRRVLLAMADLVKVREEGGWVVHGEVRESSRGVAVTRVRIACGRCERERNCRHLHGPRR